MKYIFLTFLLIIATSFTRGNYKQDTVVITDSVHALAMVKTDSQIDNLFSERITFKNFNDRFDIMMRHMDSIHSENIAWRQQSELDAITRDEAILLSIKVQQENIELAKEVSKTKEWAGMGSHLLMSFCGTFAALMLFKGIIRGCRNIRKLKNAN